jgi:hypothetical protein
MPKMPDHDNSNTDRDSKGRQMNAPAGRSTLDQKELEDIVSLVLNEAREQGVDQAEAAASHDIGLSATARLGSVESLEYTNDRGIGVTVYKDQKKGSASTSDFSPAALREAVAKACSFAKYTAADECSGLAEEELMASELPDLDLMHEWDLESSDAIRIAIECEDAARSFDSRVTNSEGATVSTSSAASVASLSVSRMAIWSATTGIARPGTPRTWKRRRRSARPRHDVPCNECCLRLRSPVDLLATQLVQYRAVPSTVAHRSC